MATIGKSHPRRFRRAAQRITRRRRRRRLRRPRRQGHRHRDRERHGRHRRRPQERRPRAAARIRRARPEGRASRSATKSKSIVDRVENADGEAMLSRDRARREAAWDKLESEFGEGKRVEGVHLRPRQGRLHRRSRRRRGLPSRQPGRHPPGARRRPADGHAAALPDPQDGPPPRQYRRLAPRDPRGDPRRAAQRADRQTLAEGQVDRRRRQEHHRLRRVRRPRRHRRPAPRHRHELQARQPPVRSDQHRRHGEGADHPHQPRNPAHQPRHEAARERSLGGRRRQVSGRREVHGPRHQHHRIRRVRRARSRASRAWSTSPK